MDQRPNKGRGGGERSSGGRTLVLSKVQNVNVVRNENTAATLVFGASAGLK